MEAKRAQEIVKTGHRGFPYWGKYECTQKEWQEVKAKWDTMPGNTSWSDALLRIAKAQ